MPKRATNPALDPHCDELASMLQRRSGLVFAGSRLETFNARVREHMNARRIKDVAELLQLLRNSSVEYEALLDQLLASPSGFFPLPQVVRPFQHPLLPQ